MPKEGPLWGQPSASTRPRWLRSILATNRWHARRYGHAMVIRRGHFFCTAKMVVLVVVSRFFYFHPYLGKVIQFDESNFVHGLGWFNHQLVVIFPSEA